MEMAPGHFRDLEVTGFLVVFKDLVYLCSADSQRKPAILIAAEDLPEHVLAKLPTHGMSKLTRAGRATPTGSIGKVAALQDFPYSMSDVRRLSFQDKHGVDVDCRFH